MYDPNDTEKFQLIAAKMQDDEDEERDPLVLHVLSESIKHCGTESIKRCGMQELSEDSSEESSGNRK